MTALPDSKQDCEYVQNHSNDDQFDMEQMYKTKCILSGRDRDLIEWMCQYNQSHDNKLQYFGVHIGGFYQNWKIPTQAETDVWSLTTLLYV